MVYIYHYLHWICVEINLVGLHPTHAWSSVPLTITPRIMYDPLSQPATPPSPNKKVEKIHWTNVIMSLTLSQFLAAKGAIPDYVIDKVAEETPGIRFQHLYPNPLRRREYDLHQCSLPRISLHQLRLSVACSTFQSPRNIFQSCHPCSL